MKKHYCQIKSSTDSPFFAHKGNGWAANGKAI